ncbi:MAG: iron-containing alcohol dehydrogenase, partial [Chloroflexota bacterium]|nr:iron-containing alcohol dehydrogenase [Chloroflexota bacterium]
MTLEKAFEFVSANRIIFGNGCIAQVKGAAQGFGRKALLVCGSGSVPLDNLVSILKEADISFEIFRVENEPDISGIDAGLSKAKATGCTFVIGYGGGSVLDSAKAISAMMTNPGDLMDYLEVIGAGRKIANLP